jgi:hypothetical protein
LSHSYSWVGFALKVSINQLISTMVTSSSLWKHGEPFPFVICLHLGSVTSSNISLKQTRLTRKISHPNLEIFYLNAQQYIERPKKKLTYAIVTLWNIITLVG